MSNFDGLYVIRNAVENDRNFILQSFLLSMYYGDSWFSKIPKRIFMDNYKRVVEALVNKSKINVACLPDDSDTILGYAVMSQDETTLHYVYVKEKNGWRKHGIAKKLVPKAPVYVSHLTQLGETLLNKFEQKPIFNPFQI